ncbi:TniB family NTP-binding protein [Sinorhizobium meliloti]|uniref:TniB family NTP-binding protein n=1 Tax=Rhizobium meliloti TaxID=382 RepID=UPI002E0F2F19
MALLATELEISRATAYRLIKLFRAGGTVMSLVDRKRGRPQGHRVLDDQREKIIRTTINRYYLTRNRPTVSQLVRDVQTNCMSAGLKPPHRRTIKARLEEIDLQKRSKRRGETEIVKQTQAVPGVFAASRPLQVVQVDHTKADIFVVDEETRQPIGRPWLTLAMDVCSRMVTGFYLTMDAPSRLSTSLCLLHSVFDKSAWLREREITEPWPVAGLPEILHVDNGADFRSRAFKRGCQDAGIAIEWRPPAEPRFGGPIERLIGTQMGKLHLLPGTTFSNAQELGEYDSKRHSALTLRELERYIALHIVGSYHQSIHSSLGRPPIAVWREHEGEIPLRLPQDRMRFWLAFLPEQERTLRPTGIHLFGLRYWSAALSAELKTPVLAMEMTSRPGERRFYAELLTLLGAPQRPRADIAQMEQAALRIMDAIGVQVLVIDEVHINTLRFLSNRLRISLVCFGVNEAREAISGDVQLARRFEQFTLSRWAANEQFEALAVSILVTCRCVSPRC